MIRQQPRERGWQVEAPGFLGWLQAALVWLALAIGVSAAALVLPGGEMVLPEGVRGAAWGLLLGAGLVWALRLASELLSRQVLGSVFAGSGILAHLLLLLGLMAGRGLGGLLGVFALFLSAGEILRLIELRAGPPPAWLRRGRRILPARVRTGLAAGALAVYFILVFLSFR